MMLFGPAEEEGSKEVINGICIHYLNTNSSFCPVHIFT